jgi:glycosyltransferase involved in cell wall biosynthesis
MNILLLCYEYPPIGGGGGVGAQQYAEAWAAKGHRVRVLTSRAGALAARELVRGVEVVRVFAGGRKDRATSTNLTMLLYIIFGFLHVLARWREYRRFEVLNTHFAIPTGPLGWALSKLLGRPDVLTIIGGDIYDPSKRSSPHLSPVFRKVNGWLLKAAGRVVAISSDTRSRAERYYAVRREIGVIPYGFRPLCFHPPLPPEGGYQATSEPGRHRAEDGPMGEPRVGSPPRLPEGGDIGARNAATGTHAPEPEEGSRRAEGSAFRLIAIGRLVERKGFDYLIRAMKRLPEAIRLRIVGDGPQEPALRALAREEGVEDRVELLGFRSREEVHELLRDSDCFVLSSLHEGLGIVVQEAMDAGLPIVSTNEGGQVDLVSCPRNGILVDPADERQLADAILRLEQDPELALEMGRNNRLDIAELHIDSNCERYLSLFEELRGDERRERVPGTVA